MKTRVILGLFLAAMAGVIWLMSRDVSSSPPELAKSHPAPKATPSSLVDRSHREPMGAPGSIAPTSDGAPNPVATAAHLTPAPPSPTAPVVVAPAGVVEIATALEEVQTMLRDYRSALGENPIGTNSEIMRAINGDNLKQVKVGPPAGQRLNAQGELIDLWGTPYFFHQISRERMEIRSAGPDRLMWTADDRQM